MNDIGDVLPSQSLGLVLITERGGATAGRGGAFVVVAGCVVSVRLSSLFS